MQQVWTYNLSLLSEKKFSNLSENRKELIDDLIKYQTSRNNFWQIQFSREKKYFRRKGQAI
ncbi:hypothetical protein PRO82_001202 [Candidatus Protochlamydia amoebophila]|nr:hypothetical protein [Candidatus Protochlamydia amoebophila]